MYRYIVVILFVVNVFTASAKTVISSKNVEKYRDFKTKYAITPGIAEEIGMSTPELIRKYKYNVEIHHVMTDDGYILEIHRITGSPMSPPRKGKQPVLLMHGLFDSSAAWIVMHPSNGLGYLLADQGFDVWLGNARGNRYSRNHVVLNPNGDDNHRKKFWNFSWHEIGIYDLPAMIDLVLLMTGKDKLHYIGHSLGTTVFFVMCAELPKYNDKIIEANLLAPTVHIKPTTNLILNIFKPLNTPTKVCSDLIGLDEFKPTRKFYQMIGQNECYNELNDKYICENILFLFMGKTTDKLNDALIPVISGHTPAGSSTKLLLHYIQIARGKRFQKFDYGKYDNLVKYNSTMPSEYNLSNVTAKTILYYVKNDGIVMGMNVEVLAKELPNVVAAHEIHRNQFNHLDYVWGIDVRTLIYDNIIGDYNRSTAIEL